MKRMTPREWASHLRLCSRCSICEITPQQAGELADVIEKLIVAAELQPTTNTEAHTNGKETT